MRSSIVFSVVGLLVTAAFAVLMRGGLGKVQFFPILSESMEPAIARGDLVVTRKVAPSEYKVGDIISFSPPTREGLTVTHRITALIVGGGIRETRIYTQGDANTNGDSWVLSYGHLKGKSILVIPRLGYVVLVLQRPIGFLVVAVLLLFITLGPVFIRKPSSLVLEG